MTNKLIALFPISSIVLVAGCLTGDPATTEDAPEVFNGCTSFTVSASATVL